MELSGRVALVTGGGAGIGEALCRRFAAEGAHAVIVADIDGEAASAVATDAGSVGRHVDVGDEAAITALVSETIAEFGRIDLLCSNAGIATTGSVDEPTSVWQRAWEVNLMAHVWAARAVLPSMLERGEGYLLHTASAAGLLTNIGAAPYSVTKHAVVALAEWLSVTYGDAGITVSCLCPQFVDTAMIRGFDQMRGLAAFAEAGAISTDAVADAVIEGLRAEQFLILPHPEVREFYQGKAADYDRWLGGMRRLQHRLGVEMPPLD